MTTTDKKLDAAVRLVRSVERLSGPEHTKRIGQPDVQQALEYIYQHSPKPARDDAP